MLLLVASNTPSLVGGEKVILFSPAWTNNSRDLELSIRTDKLVYRQSEPVTLLLTITNKAGAPKILQLGSPWLKYNVRVFHGKKLSPDERLKLKADFRPPWDCSPSDPIPAGGSITEKIELEAAYDLSTPGKYTINATKWYEREPGIIKVKNGKKGVDYLDASAVFTILLMEPRKNTKP